MVLSANFNILALLLIKKDLWRLRNRESARYRTTDDRWLILYITSQSLSLHSHSHSHTHTLFRDVAQPGSAPRSGRGGREFESRHPDNRKRPVTQWWVFFIWAALKACFHKQNKWKRHIWRSHQVFWGWIYPTPRSQAKRVLSPSRQPKKTCHAVVGLFYLGRVGSKRIYDIRITISDMRIIFRPRKSQLGVTWMICHA